MSYSDTASLIASSCYTPEFSVTTPELLDALKNQLTDSLIASIEKMNIEKRHTIISNILNFYTTQEPRKLCSNTLEMSCEAIKKCLNSVDIPRDRIGLLIAITNTQDQPLPCLAYQILSNMRGTLNNEINSINMQNQGCSALLKAIEVAKSHIHANPDNYVVIVTSESHTGWIGPKCIDKYYNLNEINNNPKMLADTLDIYTTFLFGDGAAALLLGPANSPKSRGHFGEIVHMTNMNDEDQFLLEIRQGGILKPAVKNYPFYFMSKDVPASGVAYVKKNVEALKEQGITPDKADFYMIHTGSYKIISAISEILGVDSNDRRAAISYDIFENNGNLSSASITFMIDKLFHSDNVGTGIIFSFGVGFSSSSGVLYLT